MAGYDEGVSKLGLGEEGARVVDSGEGGYCGGWMGLEGCDLGVRAGQGMKMGWKLGWRGTG